MKDDKTKDTCTLCKKTFSLSNMGSTALNCHEKSEKDKKNAASVDDRLKNNQCICQYLEI